MLIDGVAVEFRVLGPVEVRVGERVVAVGRPQQCLLVAALAVDAGRPVMVETLVDRVWEEAPVGARRTLHVLLTRLRRVLEQAGTRSDEARVVRHAGGYLLDVDPEQVDLLRFRKLITQARKADRADTEQVLLLREALSLWRGEPLSGLPGPWAARTRLALRQQHLEAAVAWARAELQGGDPASVVGPLTDLVAEHPLTESLTGMLMRALYAVGRPADALTLYATARQRLDYELGADPGAELQAVHQQILRGRVEPLPAATGADVRTVPRQLPAAVAHFAGRSAELAALTTLLEQRTNDRDTVVISAIGGTAGVGKTALAVHWAHQVRERFPDGELYVNLRGFDPTGSVMAPAEAVRRFLDALGVAPQRIPADLDAQAALYRSQLAGRRMLIVLDNARDTAQVRPLLPGSPGCLAVVTSRNQLSGLVAADGAQTITIDLLTSEEARHVLARRLGSSRMTAEPLAVEEIITRCARLPLALAIVAARAATHPHLPLHTLASELRDAVGRLDILSTDDPATDVRAVFSWSCQALTAGTNRLFRLLGLHPGPDLTSASAASLAGIPVPQVRAPLAELTRANLLVEHTPGRYTFHDLLRAYATEQAHAHKSHQQRLAATHRMLDHYLHTAYAANRLRHPASDPIALAPPQPGVTPERLANREQALAWFTNEHAVLLAAVEHAAATGFDVHTWQLAWSLHDFLHRRGHWHDHVATHQTANLAAQRLADPTAQARTHRNLAQACIQLGRFDVAYASLQQALSLTNQAGDQTGQADTYLGLGLMCERQGLHPQALDHGLRSLTLFKAAGHRRGQALALNAIGWAHAHLGNHQQSLAACQHALALHQELDDHIGQAAAWDSLGYAHHHLGQYTQAITSYRQSLNHSGHVGDRYAEANTLARLGDTHHATGNHSAARTAWQQSLTILNDLDHAETGQVLAKLTALSAPSDDLRSGPTTGVSPTPGRLGHANTAEQDQLG